jgi:hypothetical protein
MAYIIGNNQTGQANNANSSPVTVSSDQLGDNKLATDESLILLRRIVKLLESNAVVDSANRQKVIVEGSANINGTIAVGNISTMAGYGQQQYIDIARNAYANGIRSKLDFT